jgi:flagellar protein FlaG
MIKSIGNSESVSSNFDNLLSNLEKGKTPEVETKASNTNKQTTDEFQRTFEQVKIEAEITKQLEEDSLIAKFSTDKETDKLILNIINQDTDEVVRQYPPEVSLKIARIVNNMIKSNNTADVSI